jgi:hypothetical protein
MSWQLFYDTRSNHYQRGSREDGAGDVSTAKSEQRERLRSVVRESGALSSSRKSPIFGRQRACAVLAAGALIVLSADLYSSIYIRAAGALEVFSADPPAITYKQTARDLAAFAVDPPAATYKTSASASIASSTRSTRALWPMWPTRRISAAPSPNPVARITSCSLRSCS